MRTNVFNIDHQTKLNQTKSNQTKPNQTKLKQTKKEQTKPNKPKQKQTKTNKQKQTKTKTNQNKQRKTNQIQLTLASRRLKSRSWTAGSKLCLPLSPRIPLPVRTL